MFGGLVVVGGVEGGVAVVLLAVFAVDSGGGFPVFGHSCGFLQGGLWRWRSGGVGCSVRSGRFCRSMVWIGGGRTRSRSCVLPECERGKRKVWRRLED